MTFIPTCALMGIFFGSGIMAGNENRALDFIFRAWVMPDFKMISIILVAGLGSAFGGYLISHAYRYSSASIIAPFEYSTLVLAVFWGLSIWGEFPDSFSFLGIFLIISSGVFIAIREIKNDVIPSAKKVSARR